MAPKMFQASFFYLVTFLLSVHILQANAAFTFNPGNPSDYEVPATDAPTLKGTTVTIVAPDGTAIPSKGIDMYISPELLEELKRTADEKCADGLGDDCQASLERLINAAGAGVQARQIGVVELFGAALLSISGIIIEWLRLKDSDEIQKGHLHLPEEQLSSLASWTTGDVVFKTTNNAGATVPVTGLNGVPSITTVTSAPDGKPTGDVIILLPEKVAKRVEDVISGARGCLPSRKRSDIVDCILSVSYQVIDDVRPNSPLENLVRIGGDLPTPVNSDVSHALESAKAYGLSLDNWNVDDDSKRLASEMSFWLVYEYQSNHQAIGPSVTIAASDIKPSVTGCPPDAPKGSEAPVCQDDDCNGDRKEKICRTGRWKFCDCLNLAKPLIYEPSMVEFWDFQQQVLSEAWNLSISGPFPDLRVLPLGDSITKGSGSSHLNGYRKNLHDLLGDNKKVDFVGTLRNGNFADQDHEGHSGERISSIKEYSERAVKARPNVILVLAGTNDLDKPLDPIAEAPDRMSSLLDSLISSCPDAAILVAEIMINTRGNMQETVDAFNQKLGELVMQKHDDGKHVMLVDTGNLLTPADLSDEKHPNDQGYEKLANAWYTAMQEANSQGWIKKPVKPEVETGVGLNSSGSNPCDGNNWKKMGTVTPQLLKTWEYKGIKDFDGALPWGKWIIWADINGDGRDDYLAVQQDGSVHAAIFDEGGNSIHVIQNLAGGIRGQSGDKVRFADIDGDGYADYIIQFDGGAATVSINTKNVGKDGQKRNFKESVTIASGVDGVPGSKVQYADINGDGRADYLIVYDGGAVKAYLNNGNLKFDHYGTVATGINGISGNRVRMTDIDGDGYADYVVFKIPEEFPGGQPKSCKETDDCKGYCEDGSEASCDSGKCQCKKPDPNSCEKTYDCLDKCSDDKSFYCSPDSHTCKCYKSDRDQEFDPSQSCKTTKDCTNGCYDLGFFCEKEKCKCALPESEDITDEPCTSGDECVDICEGDIGLCIGGGGLNPNGQCVCTSLTSPKKQKAKRDAADEPVSYLRNTRKLSLENGAGNWAQPIQIAPGVSQVQGSVHFARFNKDRFADYLVVTHSSNPQIGFYQDTGTVDKDNALRLADLDGDGKDDYIIVHADGTVDAWLNKGANDLKPLANLAAPNNNNITADKIQFADVNGDGKADYLVIWDGGSVDAYLNTGNLNENDSKRNWESSITIAPGIDGISGDKIRFADINGDGKADLCLQFKGGSVEAYINTGELNRDPGKQSWRPLPGPFAAGVDGVLGSKVRLADIDGDRLADYLVLYDGGAVRAFRNTGNLADDSKVRNFDDWGTVATGVDGVSGEQVYFADLTGDRKTDYVVVNKDGSIDLIGNECGK